jgi:hypothetical protein
MTSERDTALARVHRDAAPRVDERDLAGGGGRVLRE